jgi:hypothetical protein
MPKELCDYLPPLRLIYTSPLNFETVATMNKDGRAECNSGSFPIAHQQTEMQIVITLTTFKENGCGSSRINAPVTSH